MKVVREELTQHYVQVSFTIELSDYEQELNKILKKEGQKANVKGFRPGKVPIKLVYKLIGKGIKKDILSKKFGQQLRTEISKLTHQEDEKITSHFLVGDYIIDVDEIQDNNILRQNNFLVKVKLCCYPRSIIDYETIKYPIDKIDIPEEFLDDTIKCLQLQFSNKTISITKDNWKSLQKLQEDNPDHVLIVKLNEYSLAQNINPSISNIQEFEKFIPSIKDKIVQAFESEGKVDTSSANDKVENISITLSDEEIKSYFIPGGEDNHSFEIQLILAEPSTLDEIFFNRINEHFSEYITTNDLDDDEDFDDDFEDNGLEDDDDFDDNLDDDDFDDEDFDDDFEDNGLEDDDDFDDNLDDDDLDDGEGFDDNLDDDDLDDEDFDDGEQNSSKPIKDLDTFKILLRQVYQTKNLSIENKIFLKKSLKIILDSETFSIPDEYINDLIDMQNKLKTKEKKSKDTTSKEQTDTLDHEKIRKEIRTVYQDSFIKNKIIYQAKLKSLEERTDDLIYSYIREHDEEIEKYSEEFYEIKNDILKKNKMFYFQAKNIFDSDVSKCIRDNMIDGENFISFSEAQEILENIQ